MGPTCSLPSRLPAGTTPLRQMVGGGDGANAEPAEGDGSGFAVEQILRSFKRRGTSFYIVKWAGFEERTIEPAGEFCCSPFCNATLLNELTERQGRALRRRQGDMC